MSQKLHTDFNITVAKMLEGKHFAITGKMERKRDEIVTQLESLGGIFDKSVRRGTNLLITGEKVGQGKLTAAEKFGTVCISESAFWNDLEAEDNIETIFMF